MTSDENIWAFEPNGEEWITASRNEERADWAQAAVVRFREVCRGDMDDTALYDLIANIGHLFDRLRATTDYREASFEDLIKHALLHYHAERGEGDDIEEAFRQ